MYLKVLVDGNSSHGGKLKWSLPHDGQPSDWHEVEGDLELYEYGLHFTDDTYIGDWLKLGCQVYEIEPVKSEGIWGRYMSSKARLIREIPPPMWWQAGTEFLRHAQAMTFFDNHEQPNPEWQMFDTRETALHNMRVHRPGSMNFILSRVNNEILVASRMAYKNSADKELESFVIIAEDESTSVDVALYAKMLMLEDDLSQSSKEYIKRRWDIYKRGYGCAGDVNDIFYVYKTQPWGVKNMSYCRNSWQAIIR